MSVTLAREVWHVVIDSVKEDARNSFNRLGPERTKIRRSGRSFRVSGGYKKQQPTETRLAVAFLSAKGRMQSAEGK